MSMSSKRSIIYLVFAIATFKLLVLCSALPTNPSYDQDMTTQSVSADDKFVDKRAGILQADFKTFRKQLRSPINETLEAEEMLIWFVSQLKSFIHEDGFEVYKFQAVQLKLAQALADISSLARDYIYNNKLISKQFNFARQMFESMALSAQDFEECEHVRSPSEFLLETATCLNIKLFTFYDFYGNPDLKSPNFAQKLHELWRELCECEEEFYALEYISDYDKRRFDDTFISAAETIHFFLEIATYNRKF